MTAFLKLIPSGTWVYLAMGALSAAFICGWHLRARIADGDIAQHQAKQADQAELQRIANRDRARTAEQTEAAQVVYRDRIITKTVERVRDATAPLASCPVPDAAIRMLNDAAACTRQGRSAACAADDALPGAGNP